MRGFLQFHTERFTAYLRRLADASDHHVSGPVQDALYTASDKYWESMRLRFASASEGDGTWDELKPRTVAEHERIGDTLPHVLHFTGTLEESLQRGTAGHVLELTPAGLAEGTNNFTARFHQDGTTRMVARPIVVEPDAETLDSAHTELAVGLQLAVKAASYG